MIPFDMNLSYYYQCGLMFLISGVLLLIVLGLCFITIWPNYNKPHSDATPIRTLIKTITTLVLIAGLIIGIGVLSILGVNAAIGIVVVLMSIPLGYGLWVFWPVE